MTDEQVETEAPKRSPGGPRGAKTKRRNAVREPVHQGRGRDDGQDPLENFEYRPFEAENPLAIEADIVRSIQNEWNFSLLWVCFENCGKPTPHLVSARKKNGYAEVKRGNFGGALDHLCDRDGNIRKEGLMLMGRPAQIERMAKAHDAKMAKQAVSQMVASHSVSGVEGITMPDGNNEVARAKNAHHQTYEPGPRIPD